MLSDMQLNAPLQTATYEPNWLFSTAIQSAAALVAIIGGLLVSRLVSLSSEKSASLHQIRTLDQRRSIIKRELEDIHGKVLTTCTKWFLEHHLADFVEAKGEVHFEEKVNEWSPRGASFSEMVEVADWMSTTVKRAFQELSARYPVPNFPPTTVEAMVENGMEIEGANAEVIFEEVAKEISRKRRPPNALGSLMDTFVPNLSAPREIDRHDAQLARLAELRTHVSLIDAEIFPIEMRILVSLKTPGLIGGFLVLAYFGAVGILFPLWLMTRKPIPEGSHVRDLVFVGFLSGFLALLWYVQRGVRELRRDSSGLKGD